MGCAGTDGPRRFRPRRPAQDRHRRRRSGPAAEERRTMASSGPQSEHRDPWTGMRSGPRSCARTLHLSAGSARRTYLLLRPATKANGITSSWWLWRNHSRQAIDISGFYESQMAGVAIRVVSAQVLRVGDGFRQNLTGPAPVIEIAIH